MDNTGYLISLAPFYFQPPALQTWEMSSTVYYKPDTQSPVGSIAYLSIVDFNNNYVKTVSHNNVDDSYSSINIDALINTNSGTFSIIFQSTKPGNILNVISSVPDTFAPITAPNQTTWVYGHYLGPTPT